MPDDKADACSLPTPPPESEVAVVQRLLQAKRIAVVGASDDPSRASYSIVRYLLSVGKEVVPVNPNYSTVQGLTCVSSLKDVPQPIDLVNVFRRASDCLQVVREAIDVGAGGVWLQSGIFSEESKKLAERAGVPYVQNRCIMVDHMYGQRGPVKPV